MIPTNLWGSTGAPFPTNVWWNNIVLGTGDQNVVANPYMLKVTNVGLSVCVPYHAGADTYYYMACADWAVLSATEALGDHRVKVYCLTAG